MSYAATIAAGSILKNVYSGSDQGVRAEVKEVRDGEVLITRWVEGREVRPEIAALLAEQEWFTAEELYTSGWCTLDAPWG